MSATQDREESVAAGVRDWMFVALVPCTVHQATNAGLGWSFSELLTTGQPVFRDLAFHTVAALPGQGIFFF